MLFGLVVFLRGNNLLKDKAHPPATEMLREPLFVGLNREAFIYLGGLLGVVVIWQLIQYQELVGHVLLGIGGIAILLVLYYAFMECDKVDRDRMLVLSVLIIFSVLFWSLFEQAGSSLNVFADRSVDRVLLGMEIPASMFQSLNAFFIFMLAPIFSALWVWLARKGWEPSTPTKFGFAILQVGLGFLVLVFGAKLAGDNGLTGMVWLVLVYLLHTTGELCLSPVGLSVVTKLSLKKIVGMMMGIWFLAFAAANFIAGQIAIMTGGAGGDATIVDQGERTARVIEVYANVGWFAISVSVVLFLLVPMLRKRMHGVH